MLGWMLQVFQMTPNICFTISKSPSSYASDHCVQLFTKEWTGMLALEMLKLLGLYMAKASQVHMDAISSAAGSKLISKPLYTQGLLNGKETTTVFLWVGGKWKVMDFFLTWMRTIDQSWWACARVTRSPQATSKGCGEGIVTRSRLGNSWRYGYGEQGTQWGWRL